MRLILFIGLVAAQFQNLVEAACKTEVTVEVLENALNHCGQSNENAKGQNMTCPNAFPYVTKALEKYELTSRAQIGFYLSIMAVESGNLTYNRNIWPGTPGQGTRSMMMPNNLHAFVKDSPDIVEANPELKEIADKPYNDTDDVTKNKLLEVLMKDDYTFLPGAWWIKKGAVMKHTECKDFPGKLSGKPTMDEFDKILKACVGVESNLERRTAFTTAFNAIKCIK